MGQNIIGTSDRYTQLICNTSSELLGDYPSITFRIHYNFQVRITASGSWYWNGFQLTFHTQSHSVNLSISGNNVTSGILASGYIDLPIGGQTTTHAPGFGCSGPFSASGIASETQTIPNGSMTANLVSNGHNSCVINVAMSSPRNYFYTRIYNATIASVAIGEAANGNNTVSGLTPGTNYTFYCELYNRTGTKISSKTISFMTTGFSYLDSSVSNTIGNAIAFVMKTYNDSFSTKIKVTCGNLTLHETTVKSTGNVYHFNYTPYASQLASIYALIPNALSVAGLITLTTYVNGSSIGSQSYNITYHVNQSANAPVITSFDYVDTVQASIDKTGNYKWVLQNVSKLQIKDIVASAKNSASIVTYRVNIGSSTINSANTTILVNEEVKSDTGIHLTIIDSRGLQSVKHLDFTRFISYSKPYFTDVSLTRVNDVEERTTLTMKGWFDRLSIDEVDKNVALTFKYRYRQSDSSTWSAYSVKEVTLKDNQFTYANVIGNFDKNVAYVFELLVSDYFYSDTTESLLMKGNFELFIGDGFVEVNGELDVENARVKGALGFIRELGANEDLNNCTIEGYYHQRLNEQAANGKNYPIGKAGQMTVISRDYIYQTYQTYAEHSRLYYRGYYNGKWFSWQVVSIDGHNHDGRYYTGGQADLRYAQLIGAQFTGNVGAPQMWASDWFVSVGISGWRNNTYGGGIYMSDTNYIRSYNNKAFVSSGFVRTDTGHLCMSGNGVFHMRDADSYLEVLSNHGAKGINWWASDKSLKEHIKDSEVHEALAKIALLKHVEFDWKDSEAHVELGYVADEVEKVLDCLTFDVEQYDEDNKPNGKYLKHINHTTLIPLITMGMQELLYENELLWTFNNQVVKEFEKQETVIADLTARLEKLEKGN